MADAKISQLSTATPATSDYVEILDVSDTSMGASGSNKKALVSALPFDPSGTAAAAVAALSSVYQPLDSDLTAIAALTTTSFGRALLELADAAAGRTALGLGTLATQSGTFSGTSSGTNTGDQDLSSYATTAAVAAGYQPLDSDLTAIAALATTSYGRALLALADAAALRTAAGLVIGTDVQAFDADLSALAALSGTNTIYYRSGAATWTAVTIGSNLTFSGGTLSASGGGGTAADPTASVGLTAVNGSASTYLRSDGAPALSQAIAPTWTGQHTFASGTITASTPAIQLTQTWNSGGVTFVAASVDVTDTASATASLLLDLKVGGSTKFRVNKAGQILTGAGSSSAVSVGVGAANYGFYLSGSFFASNNGTAVFDFRSNGVSVGTGLYGFSSGIGIASDTAFTRAAAKVVSITDGSSAGGTLRSIPLSPAQITANQNNYAPGVAWFYRLSSDASRDITGLSVSQVDGQVAEIWNVGSNNIVLKHEDASSTAANRFICTGAADITLAANEVALLRYDNTTARWRVRKV